MVGCPYCHSSNIRFSNAITLHYIRAMIGSEKRYCSHCEKKWKVRSRQPRVNTSFYAVSIPLTLVFSLGLFHMTDGKARASMSSGHFQAVQPSPGSALQKMALGSELSFFMKVKGGKLNGSSQTALSGLSGNQRRMAEKALKNMSPDAIQAKLKKLQSNPQTLARLSGESKEVVEQALKMMKKQKR